MATGGKRVLIFGDSLSVRGGPGHIFGHRLKKELGATIYIDSRVGRSAYSFLARAGARAHLRKLAAWKPDIVFVILGTNDLGMGMKQTAKAMVTIRDAFPNADQVIGIGPPTLPQNVDHVVRMMKDVFHDFFDLRQLTKGVPRTKDGVHFPYKSAQGVANLLFHQFARIAVKMPRVTRKTRIGPAALAAAGLLWVIDRRNRLAS